MTMTSKESNAMVRVNYAQDQMPEWVRNVIDEALAIEQEDARTAGSLGFITRALVSATMPYKDPKTKVFERHNGDMTLTILSPNGVPFGKYPRLLMSYLVTEAVASRSNVIELGGTLAEFLKTTMNVKATGGKEGTQTRLSEQMQRLFTSVVSVSQRVQNGASRGFSFENITLVDRGSLNERDMGRLDRLGDMEEGENSELWKTPQVPEIGKWNSRIELTTKFYQECIDTPVPIDLRAYKVLSEAPMAMDIYAWLTYRASYVKKATRPIPWQALQGQFGSGLPFTEQGGRDFKKAFKRNLELVRLVYPGLKVDESSNTSGLVLLPSPTHIPKISAYKQRGLF
jgi:Plasmid encoded RepA protein